MPIRFIPTGQLDITTDPTMLPEQAIGDKLVASDALTRCTNLRLGHKGMARNRWGSSKINATAIDTNTSLLLEHQGHRYEFSGGNIYRDETLIESGLTDAFWSAIIYNQYNSEEQSIFALNGTDLKRIDGSNVYEWGTSEPVPAPLVNPSTVCSHKWEMSYIDDCALWGITAGDYQCSSAWEAAYIDEGSVTDHNVPIALLVETADGDCTLGKHSLAISYVTANGETAMGGITSDIEIDSLHRKINLINIRPGGSDVVARKIYMSKSFDNVRPPDLVYYHVHTIYDNTTISYIVDVADAMLTVPCIVHQYQNFAEVPDTTEFVATDVYGVRYTYVIEADDGSIVYESNPSDPTYFTIPTTGADKAMIVLFERATDSRITHAKFYRTLDGAGVFYYESKVDIKRGQAVLAKTDGQLGQQVEIDHDRPPLGSMVLGPNYGGISFILKDNLVHYSATGRPEYWPPDYYIEASTKDFPLISGTFLDTQFYVGSANDIYLVTLKDVGYTATVSGTTTTTVAAQRIDIKSMNANTGTQARQVFKGVKGHGLFHLGIDGLYQLTGSQYQPLYQGEGTDNNITNLNFRQIFEGQTVGTIPGMNRDAIANCFLVVFKSKVFFAYPGIGSTYCDNMLVFGLIHRKVVHYQYPVAFRTAAVDYTNQRLLAADESGYIWHIEDMDLTTDEGADISWSLESKEFTLFQKMFPRTARYDVEVGDAATGYILLNGVSKQTHTLGTGRRNKKRLITGCNGDRLSIRLEGTGEVKIHKVEIE